MFTTKILVDGVCRWVGDYVRRDSAELAADVQMTMIQAELAHDGKTHTFEGIVTGGDDNGHDMPPCGAMFGNQFVEFAPNS